MATVQPPAPADLYAAGAGPLTLGSMCTGYGGLDLAVAQVFDVAPAWVADPDPGAAAILAHHWPTVPNLGDITAVDWTTVPPVDVLCAGYPCQPFSHAGKRKGTADDRHLWPHIADALRVLRPRLAIFENVANHLRLGFADVLADLAGLGFDAEWCLASASEVGAAHQRRRLFVLAWPADATRPRLQGPRLRGRPAGRGGAAADADRVGGDGPATEHRPDGRPVAARDAAADPAGLGEREPADPPHPVTGGGQARPEPRGAGVQPPADANGGGGRQDEHDLPARQPDSQRGLAADAESDGRDEGRPEPARLVRRPDAALRRDVAADTAGVGHGHARPAGVGGLAPAAVASAAADADRDPVREQPITVPGSDGPAVAELDRFEWGDYAPAVDRWARITGRATPAPTEPGRHGQPRLNPAFVEWLMGLPAGHVTAVPGLTRNAQLKALGNGVVPQQGAAALAHLLDRMEAA